MYNLMIVEDEPIERQGIRLMLENNVSGLSAIWEAADGMEAIEIFSRLRPHIVLVDIHMPGISGLETIESIRKLDGAARFIILTSHEKFEYAHEAIKLGVDDYLLKPARIAKLKESVQSVIDKLEHDQAEKTRKTALLERMDSIRPILERDLLYALIRDVGAPPRPEDFRFFDFEVSGGFCFVLACGEDDQKCLANVKQVFQQIGLHCIGEQVNGRLAFFALFGAPRQDADPEQIVAYVLNQLKISGIKCAVRAGVSGVADGIPSMRYLYSEAASALEQAARSGQEIRRFDVGAAGGQSAKSAGQYLQELRHSLAARDVFEQKVASIAQRILRPGDIPAAREEMAGILASFRAWRNEASGMPVSEAELPADALRADDANALAAAFQRNMLSLAQFHWQGGGAYSNTLIGRVLQHIEQHYMENLSLDSIAEQFHITSFYLSRMINTKIGRNFPDILAERRIREAKLLLRRGVGIKQVTYEVGFSSQNYFGKTFKRLTGMTPSEYRSLHFIE